MARKKEQEKGSVVGLPEGFTLRKDTTKVGDLEYPYEAPQIPVSREGVDILVAYYDSQGHDGWAVLAGVWNAANDQNAKQSPKTAIRNAVAAEDATEDSIAEAIAKAQETSRTFITGAPRGSLGGGMTKTAARTRGEALARAEAEKGRPLTPEEMHEIWNNPDLEA